MKKYLFSIAASTVLGCASYAQAQVSVGGTHQLSVGISGQVPNGASAAPAIAPNGGFLAFSSNATNLVQNDNSENFDIFIRDLTTGALFIASVNSSGIQGNFNSSAPSVSSVTPNGLYAVAFSSFASNFGTSNDNVFGGDDLQNVFARFPTLGLTEPISIAPDGSAPDGFSGSPSITINPALNKVSVAYFSTATNLVSNDTSQHDKIFLATMTPPTSSSQNPLPSISTKLISLGADGSAADNNSAEPKISADGNWIVFSSRASNLISGKKTAFNHIFLYNVATGAISLISQTSTGVDGNADSSSPVISYNGRFIVYLTSATNLVANPQDAQTALLVHDTTTGTTRQVNTASDGTPGNGSALDPSISANGRFVTFSDSSTNLVSPATDGSSNIFVKDLDSGVIELVSKGLAGGANGNSDNTYTASKSFNSLNGSVAFRSFASNLSSSSTNGDGDVFLTDLIFPAPQLTAHTKLNTPADLTVKRKSITVTMQKFTIIKPHALDTGGSAIDARTTPVVRYGVQIQGTGARKRDQFNQVSQRNSVTMKNLKPGNYTARYRVITQKAGKTVAATPFSPRATFTIRK